MARQEIRTRHTEDVLAHITAYVRAGHPIRFESRHGEDEHDNEIAFALADWPAFVAILEPDHPIARASRR